MIPSATRVAHRHLVRTAKLRMDPDRLDQLYSDVSDEGFKRRPGYISIAFVNEASEDKLRELGFDFPTRKEGFGKITYKGRTIGQADNFSGLVFNKPEAKAIVWKHRRVFEDIGFWYTN
jgi:hypothetical protein